MAQSNVTDWKSLNSKMCEVFNGVLNKTIDLKEAQVAINAADKMLKTQTTKIKTLQLSKENQELLPFMKG